ncbi:ThiF family adenylyltransferase [candidate division KSB1 bacterium]|nr:ThiF family adenylyltransferase [candidate division KSB1 bacterium]
MSGINLSESDDSRGSRYARQISLRDIGQEGQRRISTSHVLVLGCGGLGSAAAEMLVRMGVGQISLADRDIVELSNLQRQSLYTEADVAAGLPKAIAARRMLEKINSHVRIKSIVDDLNRFNIESLIEDVDFTIDATDNDATRFLINEVSVKLDKAWIFGACGETSGMSATFVPGITPCFRCLFERSTKDRTGSMIEDNGIISPVVHLIASIQCAEALKLMLGRVDLLNKALLSVDLWQNLYVAGDFADINTEKNCPVCNYRQFDHLEGKYGTVYASLFGPNSVHILPFNRIELDPHEIASRCDRDRVVSVNEYAIKLSEDPYDIILFFNGRVIVHGTTDVSIARDVVKKYVVR